MRLIYTLCLLLAGLGHLSAQEKNYEDAFTLIEVWLDAQRDYDKLPGITALVLDDQEVRWKGAFGMANVERSVEAEPSTLFSICSISKLFTSVAIMKLYDEGKLRLDDRVSDLLPWYNLQQQFPESGPITVRSLLTHSAGLPREAGYPYWSGPDFPFPTQEQVKAKLGEQETLYPASTYFQYSNLGLTLLGEIVEQVSGQSYDSYIQQHILSPLGLTNTRTELPEDMLGDELAVAYGALTRHGDRPKVKFFQAKGIKAAAGFSSNVEDLGKFAAWQLRLRDTTTTEILRPATLKDMQRVHWIDPDWNTSWGLGFSVYKGSDNKTWVGHGGSCPGYRSTLRIDPKNKRAYVVMINAGGTNPNQYASGIGQILSKVKDKKESEWAEDGRTEKDLSDYVGYYDPQPWGSERYIGIWQDQLVSITLPTDSPGNAMTFYKHVEGDTFRRLRSDGEPGEALNFIRDDEGRVVRVESHGTYIDKVR